MTEKGIWLKQDKKCSDIFYHIKAHIQINHQWNAKDRYDVITTEYSWNNGDCSLVKTNGREIFTATCNPLWFEIEPVWCNFTYRIVYMYDANWELHHVLQFNVANKTDEYCEPVHQNRMINVLKEDSFADRM